MGEGIISHRILEQANVVSSKAQDYLRREEPEFWSWLAEKSSESVREIMTIVRTKGPKPGDEIMSTIMKLAVKAVMAEILARDTMDRRDNPKLSAMVRAGYSDLGKSMDQAVEAVQGTPLANGKSFDETVGEVTGS